MNTKLLKQKILDLAMRGKLTEQRKSDGTARELLERISAERTESKKSVSKASLRTPSELLAPTSLRAKRSNPPQEAIKPIDKDEAPFEIPASWAWVKLGDIVAPMKSTSPKGDFFKYIDIDSIDNSVCKIKAPKIIETKKAPSRASRFTKAGDVLFSLVRPYLRNIAKVTENDCIASTGFFVCSPILVNSDYCYYLLISNFAVNGLNHFMKGDNSPSISSRNMIDFTVPLPPIAEQRRIVAKIEEAFAEIDAIEKKKESLKRHIAQARQKILDLAIHGKLVPQNKADGTALDLLKNITHDKPHYGKMGLDDVPFGIPENWCWCRLRDISESIQYGYNAPAKESGRIKMIRISDIHENEVKWDSVPYCDIDEKDIPIYSLKKNDILFARTGGTVGKSFIVTSLSEDAIYAGYLIRTRYGKNINAQYTKFFMESNLYWEQLKDGCIATAQPNCNGKTLGKMKFPLPPLAEQNRIVAKIDELFAVLDQIEGNLV